MESRIAPKGTGGAASMDEFIEDVDVEDKAFLIEGKDLSGKTNIRRPQAPQVNAKENDFIFMQIDTDYYS
jgi:hypothetical protein